MESGLNKAFCGVYNSSKEIIKNNQRHLYCNMLDLLARTTKTTGDAYLKLDDFIIFWANDILPLVFDEDKDIQKSAVSAMETVAHIFDFKILHSFPEWSGIKTKIVQNYSKEINKYREASNSCWYKIWCILIRILDKEIIKGASTINTFLSIVELGFRSPDYNVRAEAFYCWKVLIEIFAKNEEICSPKRIRLICIPLKSSHSKTTQAAAVKFKVWWYLITKIHLHIEEYIDTILEPFLAFCYGSVNRNSSCVLDFKEMTVLCLVSMLGNCTKLVKRRMEHFDIENIPEPIINKNIMQKSWKQIINYTIEAIKDCKNISTGGSELYELLLGYILKNVISIENIEALNCLFDNLRQNDEKCATHSMQKFISNYTFPTCIAGIEDNKFLGKSLSVLCSYIILNDVQTSANSIEQIMESIFLIKEDRFRHILDEFLNNIFIECRQPMETCLTTWKLITKSLIKNFNKSHQSECDANLNIINQWIIWPLKSFSESNDTATTKKMFDDQFEALLYMAVERLNGAIDKITLLKEIASILYKMYTLKASISNLDAYFGCFNRIFNSSQIEYDEQLLTSTFGILKTNLSSEFQKGNFEICMKCLKGLVTYLDKNGIQEHFEDIKDVWSHVINKKRSKHIEKSTFDEYRKQFLDDVKKVASKAQYHKIKNYLDNDDLFVIIPSVWSLNPDKLTERQKEKFYEKSDIPALYNDMSQSQDAFIKPWTPKKLVIGKGQAEEIVIENPSNTDKTNEEVINSLNTSDSFKENKEESFTATESPKLSVSAKDNSFETPKRIKSEPQSIITQNKTPRSINKSQEEENSLVNVNGRITRGRILSNEVEETAINADDYQDNVEAIISKDAASPPDRKQTNNSTSPVLKPKTTHLTGRGAQLINMIRNKKHENYNSKQMETSTPITKMEQHREKSEAGLNSSNTDTETKPSPINLLVFSKALPSPCASPSASILKRKHMNESMDDIYDTQAFKRKRVSFHDPPVSITKEYLKDEENKNNSKRCLLLDQDSKGNTKHMLRRSTKIENQVQSEHISDLSSSNGTPIRKAKLNQMNFEETVSKNAAESAITSFKESFQFLFKTESDLLNCIVSQFSIEDILEKYLSEDKTDKTRNNISKFISNNMNKCTKFKSTILETLSEKHPKEFLDYAIQENLSSVVCDRLNTNSIIEYISSKSQTNVTCRQRLFQEVHDILNNEKLIDEKCEFIQKVLTSKSMSDQQLLNLIEILFESRRKHQRAVSESAIDSSSTL